MNDPEKPPGSLLGKKFSELLAWERAKRREQILLASLAYAFLVSALLLPVRGALPVWAGPLYVLPVLFLIFAAGHFCLRPWGEKAFVQALHQMDRSLRLDARALTAAEILKRNDARAAERYVLHEAAEKLKSVDVRALNRRRWSWHAIASPPLVLIWCVLFWLGVGADFRARGSRTPSAAEKLKEFSQDLKRKAEAQNLAESLEVARALQALAEERLGGKSSESELGERLAAMEQKLGQKTSATDASDSSLAGREREDLTALRAELETARGEFRAAARTSDSELLERLRSLPRLRDALEQGGPTGETGAGDLPGALDRLERDVTGELDHRALADAREFLSLLLRGRGAGETQSQAQIENGGTAQKRSGEEAGGEGELAGDQPGTGARAYQPPTSAGARAPTRLPGMMGAGASSGLTWREEAKGGASKTPEQNVGASYRRQLEEDLASEKIPPALKETVRKYFLSLGMAENQ